jgi:hypothetical protein
MEAQQQQPRFIFSLTTSPTRINELKQTIDSLLAQTYPATHIRINVPLAFGRTGEAYVIPEWLAATPGVRIHRCDTDYGPGTKLVPTVLEPCAEAQPDDWIVTVDDDIRYQPFLLEELAKVIRVVGRKYTYGVSGCRITDYELNGKRALSLSAFYDNTAGKDIILEAYCAIAYPRGELFADTVHFKDYVEKTLMASRECKFSDDVVLSNYSLMQGNLNYLVFGKVLCRPRFWADGCVRDVGNGADALHEMKDWDSPEARYIRVFDFLREAGLLRLQVLTLDAAAGPFVVGAVEKPRAEHAIPNSRKRKALQNLWDFANKVKEQVKIDEYSALQQIANLYLKKDQCFEITFVNERKGIACKVNLA